MHGPQMNSNGMGDKRFATTHWSLVLRAGDSAAPEFVPALEELCRDYWYPLYVFVRGSGHGPEEARDLTQEFFAKLLEKKWLKDADPQRGRFRNFLLAALKHFLANDWHRSQTQKRGGGCEWIELDAIAAEERFVLEPADATTPEALYERRWATTMLARAQDRLRAEMIAAGQGERYDALEPLLAGERTEEGYQSLAARFGLSETGVKSMALRLRRRFRALLEEEVGRTLLEGEDLEDEMREMLRALGG